MKKPWLYWKITVQMLCFLLTFTYFCVGIVSIPQLRGARLSIVGRSSLNCEKHVPQLWDGNFSGVF